MRLSDIERGYATPTPAELDRISDAIDRIVDSRRQVARIAAEQNISLVGVL